MKLKTKKPFVSVVIPSYNSRRYIARCLHSLLTQQTIIPYEIIVVDSSRDDTPAIIKKYFPAVTLIHLKKQTFPGAARNIGVEKARGKIIAFIDSDCVAAPDWLEKGIHTLRQGYSFVGGAVKNAHPGFISTADYIITFNEFFPTMPSRRVSFMPTCNFMCFKDAFKNVGGFEPSLLAGEDTLFCHQVARKFFLYFSNSLLVSHHNRTQFILFIHHHYNFGRYSARLRKKIDLPGKVFAQYPILALGIPGIRFIRILVRMMRWNYTKLPQFIKVFPLIFIGIGGWGSGFLLESINRR